MGYTAYNLSKESKEMLLQKFVPSFEKVVCHHITHQFGVSETAPLPPKASLKVVGYAVNDRIECLVVEVNGSISRPSGGIYHITLSHKEGTKPVESNDLLKSGYQKVSSLEIIATPCFNK